MPQADRTAGAILGTVFGVGLIGIAIAVNLSNKGEQISKHIAANTPVDTTPAYGLIHTEGPHYNAPSAPPDSAGNPYAPSAPPASKMNEPSVLPTFNTAPTAPPQGNTMDGDQQNANAVYGDAFLPPNATYTSPTAPPSYAPTYQQEQTLPAFNPSAVMPVDGPENTIDYNSACPKPGTTLEIMCPSVLAIRHNIQYIRFNDNQTYELRGNIAPNQSSEMFDTQGNKFGTIRWKNPRA